MTKIENKENKPSSNKKNLELKISNTLGIKVFELEFSNITYDIFYEVFNKDLHISFLECVKTGGGITRAFSHRLVYAMLKTKDDNIVPFKEFIFGLKDNISEFTGEDGWGPIFSSFVLEIFAPLLKIK